MISFTQLIFFLLILFLLFGDAKKYIGILQDFIKKASSKKDKEEDTNKKS